MERRAFLQKTVGGIGVLAETRIAAVGMDPALPAAHPQKAVDPPADGYQPPDWLRYMRAIYFDGYSPPVYPHMNEFDAARAVESVFLLDGDTFRFQPMSYGWLLYPSKAFPRHPELGGRDLIDEVARECRKRGIHLFCYVQYGQTILNVRDVEREPRFAEWVRRSPDGKPFDFLFDGPADSRPPWSRRASDGNLFVSLSHLGWGASGFKACTQGDPYREGLRNIVREYCAHDIEGVYFDAPSSYRAVCFCPYCRKNFHAATGLDLSRLEQDFDLEAPARDLEARIAWYEWAYGLTHEDLLDFRKIIHGSGKFMLCHNGATWRGPSLPLQYRIPEGFMVEHSDQVHQRLLTGLMGASMARPGKKLAQMYLGGFYISDRGQPRHEKPWATHNTDMEDGEEILMEGMTNLACGNAPIYATANRLCFGVGSGSAQPAKEVFSLMRQVEPIHKDSVPVPYLAMVPSWESLQLWRTNRTSWNDMMNQGFLLAMLDARISFDVNPSPEMTEAWLDRQRVVALCGASGMSDEQGAMLTAWVKRGGGLLATFDTGLYNQKGQLRRDGGCLREVLGVEMKGEPISCRAECYYRCQVSHPALGRYGEGTTVLGDSQLVPVEVKPGAQVLADCWNLGTKQSHGPAIVVNEYGQGRSIYVGGSLEAHYAASAVRSLRELLGAFALYLAKGAPLPYQLSAPRGVYGILRRTADGDLALWVLGNVGSKDADIGRMRQEYVPVSNVEVRVLVPQGRKVKGVDLVRAGRSAPFEMVGGYAVATIPTLHIAEIVHVKM